MPLVEGTLLDDVHHAHVGAFWTSCEKSTRYASELLTVDVLVQTSADWREVTCPSCLTKAEADLERQVRRGLERIAREQLKLEELRKQQDFISR